MKRRPPQGNHTHTPPATPQKDAPDLAQNATPRAAPLPAARSWPRTGLPRLPVPCTRKPDRPEALTLRPPHPRRAAVRSRRASLTAVWNRAARSGSKSRTSQSENIVLTTTHASGLGGGSKKKIGDEHAHYVREPPKRAILAKGTVRVGAIVGCLAGVEGVLWSV